MKRVKRSNETAQVDPVVAVLFKRQQLESCAHAELTNPRSVYYVATLGQKVLSHANLELKHLLTQTSITPVPLALRLPLITIESRVSLLWQAAQS